MAFILKCALILLFSTCIKGIPEDPNCNIKGTIYRCKGKMEYIPKTPQNISTLIIQNGHFENLTQETFTNISVQVTRIKLIKCDVKFIEENAFKNLTWIEELDLSRNFRGLTPEVVWKSLYSLEGSRITSLSLNWMGWTEPPENMFGGLINTNITEIHLNHNLIRNISRGLFQNLRSLRTLDLSWNGLTDNVTFSGMTRITYLDLSGNWFFYFPNFCDNKNKSYIPDLRNLSLSQTKIQTLSRNIKCVDNLQQLNLSAITVRRLYNNTFSNLKKLNTLKLNRLGSQLLIIEPLAFNSSSLKELHFSMGNGYKFTDDNVRHFHPKEIFKHCPKLESLDLSKNTFHLNKYNFKSMFDPIKKLTSLTLNSVGMKNILNIGEVLPHLKVLRLASNKIKSWTESKPFDKLRCLETLDLSGNKISLLKETSFPKFWLRNKGHFKKLLLNGNPFSCTCDIREFQEWMTTASSFNISMNSNNLTCSKSSKRLIDYQPSKSFECLLEYIVPCMTLVPMIIIICLVVYICRFRILLIIFKRRSRKKKYERLLSTDFKYDAYIVYDYEDLSWVQNKLIEKLENQHHRHLCIRDRDFEVGMVFSSHIVDSIQESRTVIFLLSENFAKDKWCEFQMVVANHMNIINDAPSVIPILLEDIRFSVMTEPIYNILNNHKYIRWPKKENDEDLFWNEVLENIPQIRGHVYNEYSSLLYSR